ncbi:MAG: SCO family protein [Chitinophagaceae bacterium]
MSKKGMFYVGFFVVLVMAFYLIVRKWIAPPPPISIVQPFSFLDQDGKRVTNDDVKGKVYVAEFFFTNCTGYCPRMNNNLRPVYEKFKNDKDFLILSHTCDPERDSVQQLKYYSDSMKVDTHKWIFLTGPKDSLYGTARISYTLDDPNDNLLDTKNNFLHTQLMAVVNKKGEVRALYDGLKPTEINKMMKKIETLLKEPAE